MYEEECRDILTGFETMQKSLEYLNATEDQRQRELQRFPLLPLYDLCLKCSHLFNILDARGAISVTERVGVIARVRALAVGIAKAWVDQQTERSAEKSDEPEAVTDREARSKKEKLSPVCRI